MSYFDLYIIAFTVAFLAAVVFTPLARALAKKWNIYDRPHSDVKTHKEAVPYLGGVAIAGAFYVSMLVIRLATDFPTGTLRSLRGIFAAGLSVFALGLIDDVRPKGLHFREKFVFQLFAAVILIIYDIRIHFVQPEWLSIILTIFWVIGITNAFNIIDIMDGLSSGVAVIAAFAFFFIGLPGEEHLYVNFAAIGLAGAALGFIPFNVSKKRRIFMGDAGSLFIGTILSAIALGTKYTQSNNMGLFVPILILSVPIYDTLFVMYVRYKKRLSPFLGSKDHFALRLRALGCSDKGILLRVYVAAIIFLFAALGISKAASDLGALIIYLLFFLALAAISRFLYKIKV